MVGSPGRVWRLLAMSAGVDGLTPMRRFFTFMLLMFLLHSLGLGLFRFVASLCRSETIASTGGSFFLIALLLLGGFLLPRGAPLLVAVLNRSQPHHARTCIPASAPG